MRSRTSLYTLLALTLLLAQPALAAPRYVASRDAALSGVVRDARGVPQMGAFVELLTMWSLPLEKVWRPPRSARCFKRAAIRFVSANSTPI